MAQTFVFITVVVHFLALAFIVFGGFLAWHWPRVLYLHLLFAGWGFSVIAFQLDCPLTAVENHFRHQLGKGDLEGGFIATYIDGVLYPSEYNGIVQGLAALLVVASYIGAFALWRHRRLQAATNATSSGLRPAG